MKNLEDSFIILLSILLANKKALQKKLVKKSLTLYSTALDIKHIINGLPGFASFLEIPGGKNKGGDWLRRNIVVNDTFIDLSGSNSMVPAKQFDGLLFIKKVSVPEK